MHLCFAWCSWAFGLDFTGHIYFFDHYIQNSKFMSSLSLSLSLSVVVFVYHLVPPFWEHLRILVRHSWYGHRMMLVGIWLGLCGASFSFFDHYIQSWVQFSSVQFSSVQFSSPHVQSSVRELDASAASNPSQTSTMPYHATLRSTHSCRRRASLAARTFWVWDGWLSGVGALRPDPIFSHNVTRLNNISMSCSCHVVMIFG